MLRRAPILLKIQQFADGRSDPGFPGTKRAAEHDSIRHGTFSFEKYATGRVGGDWPMSAEGIDRSSYPLRLVRIGQPGPHGISARGDTVLETFASQVLLLVAHPELFDAQSLERLRDSARRMLQNLHAAAPTLADLIRAFRCIRPAEPLGWRPLMDGPPLFLGEIFRLEEPASRARQAWIHREAMLSPRGRPPQAVQFLSLTRDHAREAYTVTQAAEALGIGVRHLNRMSVAQLEYPPGLVIDLARIVSVANDLLRTEMAVKSVSQSHSFPHQSAMGRLFQRFVGEFPRAYRVLARLGPMSETD